MGLVLWEIVQRRPVFDDYGNDPFRHQELNAHLQSGEDLLSPPSRCELGTLIFQCTRVEVNDRLEIDEAFERIKHFNQDFKEQPFEISTNDGASVVEEKDSFLPSDAHMDTTSTSQFAHSPISLNDQKKLNNNVSLFEQIQHRSFENRLFPDAFYNQSPHGFSVDLYGQISEPAREKLSTWVRQRLEFPKEYHFSIDEYPTFPDAKELIEELREMVDFLINPQSKCFLNKSTLFKFVHLMKFHIENLPILFVKLHSVLVEFFLIDYKEMTREKLGEFIGKFDSVLPESLHVAHPLKYSFFKIHFYKNPKSPSDRWILLSKRKSLFLKADFSEKLTLNGDFSNDFHNFQLINGECLEKATVLGFKPKMLLDLAEKWISLERALPLSEKAFVNEDRMPFASYVFQMSTPPQKWAYLMYSEIDERWRVDDYRQIHEAIVDGLMGRSSIVHENTLIDYAEQEQHKPNNNFFFFFQTRQEFPQKAIVLDLPGVEEKEILCLDLGTLMPITVSLTFNDIDLENFTKLNWRKLDEMVKKIKKTNDGEPKQRHRRWSFDTRRSHEMGFSGVDVYL